MTEINIESINLYDMFILAGKSEYANKNLNFFGNIFFVKDKKADCILCESIFRSKSKRKFVRWVNVYYDEEFKIKDKLIINIHNEEKRIISGNRFRKRKSKHFNYD